MAEHPDLQKWKDLATKQLRGRPLEDLNWKTPEGFRSNLSIPQKTLKGWNM